VPTSGGVSTKIQPAWEGHFARQPLRSGHLEKTGKMPVLQVDARPASVAYIYSITSANWLPDLVLALTARVQDAGLSSQK
jgi:hypothetical protein